MDTQYNILQFSLSQIRESVPFLLPEYSLTGLIIVLLLQTVFLSSQNHRFLLTTTAGGLLLGLGLTLFTPFKSDIGLGMMGTDAIARYFKIIFMLSGLLTIVFERGMPDTENRKNGEWYLFVVSLILGACLMVNARNLFMMYVAMEVASISAYLLTAFRKKEKPVAEAGIKYILFGAFSSAMMLYGLSWVYGCTGSFVINADFIRYFSEVPAPTRILILTMVFTGFGFKTGLVPYHFWIPDVYDNISYPTAAFFSVVPKLAGFGMLMTFAGNASLSIIQDDWFKIVLGTIAVASMTLGNAAALGQKTVKRLLAYSAIAHSGFLLLAVIPVSETGYTSLLLYSGIYAVMNFGAFILAGNISTQLGNDEIQSYAGIAPKIPVLMIAFTICMVALIGLPPTAGFIGKWYILIALWDQWQSTHTMLWPVLLIAAVLNTVISIYYYLRLPAIMVFKPADDSSALLKKPGNIMNAFSLIVSAVLIIMGIWKFDVVIDTLKTWIP